MAEYSFLTTLFFLSSGLFLGWSLGANDAANIFGTAVSTKMIKFKSAAIIASIFIILGAVTGGSGTSSTLESLGAIGSLPAAFVVALSAAFTVYIMTKSAIPVSTSQSIVGSIIGWNIFVGLNINFEVVYKIILSWILSPVFAAIFSFIIFFVIKKILDNSKIHLLRVDYYTRLGLIIVGAFGAYSLGANNIANVVGVFMKTIPLNEIKFLGIFSISSSQQLFFLGSAAIALGVITYSKRVMNTVGNRIFKLSPLTAFVVVFSCSLVLFLFASKDLKIFLNSHGLPSFPLVPISSSQAIVGSIIGVSFAKNAKNLKLKIMGKISMGWLITPVMSAIIAFVMLFFMQNVFMQDVDKVYNNRQSKKNNLIIDKSENLCKNSINKIKGANND
ncbi:MAG TPA: inorganic phosphate transporter [Candidatus Mcinerneyibacterium sp.]|nr:inorganic phosphate transporter [Candidatus Mcinerneyibacterium sp.]